MVGIGSALPERRVTNEELVERLDTTDEWIVRRTGIRERRWLNGSQSLAELGAQAAEAALADAGRSAKELSHVIVSTITSDNITPGIAPALAGLIGATNAAPLDVNAACAGFIYALEHAASLIESGRSELVLVCAAEALSRITDHDDRSTAALFGDGAGAVVLAAGDHAVGCAAFELGADAEHGAMLYADRHERVLKMDGQTVYRHAVDRMTEATQTLLARAQVLPEEIDLFVAHQANGRIVEAVGTALGVPAERLALNIELVANTSSASIPLALAEAEREGRLKPGSLVVLAAFGAGFVWGAALLSWKEPVGVSA